MQKHQTLPFSLHYAGPKLGLLSGPTVKETITSLLAEGFFDNQRSLVLGVADTEGFDYRLVGRDMDHLAITSYLQVRTYEHMQFP